MYSLVASNASLALISILIQNSVLIVVLPLYGDNRLPTRVRIILLLFLSALSYLPRLETLSDVECTSLSFYDLSKLSALFGLAVGLVLRLPLVLLEIIGAIISQVGSFSQILAPGITKDVTTIFSSLTTLSTLLIFSLYGFDIVAQNSMYINQMGCVAFQASNSITNEISQLGKILIFSLVQLGYPFFLLSLIYFTCIGLIGRVMPQFMAMLVGTPALQVGVIILLYETIEKLIRDPIKSAFRVTFF